MSAREIEVRTTAKVRKGRRRADARLGMEWYSHTKIRRPRRHVTSDGVDRGIHLVFMARNSVHAWWDQLTDLQRNAEIANLLKNPDAPVQEWVVAWRRLQFSQQMLLSQYHQGLLRDRYPIFPL
jgi:hypothetical protein